MALLALQIFIFSKKLNYCVQKFRSLQKKKKKRAFTIVTSEVFFDGTTEADGDDEAAVGLFGGRAEVFCGEEFFGGFRY